MDKYKLIQNYEIGCGFINNIIMYMLIKGVLYSILCKLSHFIIKDDKYKEYPYNY